MAKSTSYAPVVTRSSQPSSEELLRMEHKQRSVWKFMERSVRTQKASKEQLDRFCDLLQRPNVFESVSEVVKELSWDHTSNPEFTITGTQYSAEPSSLKSAPKRIESSSSKTSKSKAGPPEPIAVEDKGSPTARSKACSSKKTFHRPTQVEDLCELSLPTPFDNLDTRIALANANHQLWEVHCAGKQNRTSLYRITGVGLWPNDFPENQWISARDAVRRLIKDIIVLDGKKLWTPKIYSEMAQALADEEYGGEDGLVAMAQAWGIDSVGPPTKKDRAVQRERGWSISSKAR
ncbi:MAG: hypothetical protein Q9217_003410 [Psora testacea]